MANEKILIVDNNPAQLNSMATFLQQQGYQVTTAADGQEALQKARQEHPALIILKINLPKRSGFQVCRQLKTGSGTRDIKILLIGDKQRSSDRYWGLRQGADEYMARPFENKDLLAAVVNLLSQP